MRALFSRRALLAGAAASVCPSVAGAEIVSLAAGQEWTIRDLPDSSAIIGRIDDASDARIIHVALILGAMPEFGEPENSGSMVSHVAVTETAFLASIEILIEAATEIPEAFQYGYESWRSAGAAAVNIPVSQFVRLVKSGALRRTT